LKNKPLVSIIIRTKNEEDWIKPCLQSIRNQNFKNPYEIILVDNNSKDATLKIAKEYKVDRIVKINKFFPGRAINMGIKYSSGDKIIIISAHCIPDGKNWLKDLTSSLNNKKIAGVYARQIPLPFTSPDDSRDLLITFGLETRIQKKDFMFHNAHSIIWRDVWNKIPFDEKTENIEDRLWGKEVISKGYSLKYDPKPKVFHHHGLHQHGNNTSFRAENIAKVIRNLEDLSSDELPDFLKPSDKEVPILVPLNSKIKNKNRLFDFLKSLKEKNNESIFLYASYRIKNLPQFVTFIKRKSKPSDDIDFMLQDALSLIENKLQRTIDGLSICDYRYKHPIFEAPRKCKDLMFSKNRKFVSYAYADKGVHWSYDGENLKLLNELSKFNKKDLIYRLAFGQGATIRASKIRRGNLMTSKSSIIKLNKLEYLLRD
tara:strand:- start:181 stop:1467 length:1287 start_codon:yes stop_codon:yes gene_type:complete